MGIDIENRWIALLNVPRASPEAPVIYLDQNHWSTLFKAIYYPKRVANPAELTAAHKLIGLAMKGAVELPVCMAHYSETAQWSSREDRRLLATTMFQVSMGLQMLPPEDIQAYELCTSILKLDGYATSQLPVFTGVPGASFSRIPGTSPLEIAWSLMLSMLEDDAVERDESVATRWASKFNAWTVEIGHLKTKSRKREVIDSLILQDAAILLQVGANLASLLSNGNAKMPTDSRAFAQTFGDRPALGLWRELVFDRISSNHAWEENDLIDSFYLSAAAGCVNYIVAERSCTAALKQGMRRLGRPQTAFANIAELALHDPELFEMQ